MRSGKTAIDANVATIQYVYFEKHNKESVPNVDESATAGTLFHRVKFDSKAFVLPLK
jgi:hypothetical protein